MATRSKEEQRRVAIENLRKGREAAQKRRREAMASANPKPPLAARSDAAVPAATPAPDSQPSPTVCLNVKNMVSINGVQYIGHVEVTRQTADTIRMLDSAAETEKAKVHDSTVHPDKNLGQIG